MKPLPIDSLRHEILDAVRTRPAVILEAPPGSGKTTRVAPMLLDRGIISSNQRLFLLQPRRIAARSTAQRIASERGLALGRDVGYQVRFERHWGHQTRLIVATEGVLVRRLQDDPLLEDIGAIILDEFHERSIDTDLLLGLAWQLQQTFRPELKILIMSATLCSEPLLRLFPNAATLKCDGRLFPVDVKYRPPRNRQDWIEHAVDTVVLTAERTDGDILVFLPGMSEIHRVLSGLRSRGLDRRFDLLSLHGSMPLEEQSKIVHPSDSRRIILSTNVAETSLTIDGIRTVIDSGFARVLRFSPELGLDRLQLEPISQASATQRAGRAGRTSEGRCIRLWDEASHRHRAERLEPEICRVDLSGVVLFLMCWGEKNIREFPWLDPPSEQALDAAIQLLQALGAIEGNQVTDLGKLIGKLPVAPRLGRLMIEANRFGYLRAAAQIAAMLSEREPFLRRGSQSSARQGIVTAVARSRCDVLDRLDALRDYWQHGTESSRFGTIHRDAAYSILETAQQLFDQVSRLIEEQPNGAIQESGAIGRALLAAFPDRLARRRQTNSPKGKMIGGRGVQLAPASSVTDAEFFLCIDVDAGSTDASVRIASGVELDWICLSRMTDREELFFHPTQQQVVARQRTYIDDLLIQETTTQISDHRACSEVLFAEASARLQELLPKPGTPAGSFLERVRFLAHWAPEFQLPNFDEEQLKEILKSLCDHRRSLRELQEAPWLDWIRSQLSQEQLSAVDREAPERIEVPSGNKIRLEYDGIKPPVLAVRIQEVFSWLTTPKLAFGRVPVLLHLLAPNMRPQQITDDLESFWNRTYSVVRAELRRRYPKHAWPEDPRTAKPIRKESGPR